MQTNNTIHDTIQEARRQLEICNACRYCEGYCSVFPAMTRERQFSDGTISHLANLCHNCRGCYYACQYTEPHEFAVNLPKVLAEARQNSWQEHTIPKKLGTLFQRSGVAISAASTIGFALLFTLVTWLGDNAATAFYGVLSHNTMVAIFIPAFILPWVALSVSVKRYWQSIGGGSITLAAVSNALASAAQMKNLNGGHGDGCNFEDEDRFSQARRFWHQGVMYGFLLCFASTSTATVMHYAFNLPAPYSFFSLPKLLGVSGGIMLSISTIVMAMLKIKADKNLADQSVWSGEMAFIMLLSFISTSGLMLYAATGSQWVSSILALHLGSVLTFFLITPYSKMVHGLYRLAALIKEAQLQQAHKT